MQVGGQDISLKRRWREYSSFVRGKVGISVTKGEEY